MNVVDALCEVCQEPIRWVPVTPRRCSEHGGHSMPAASLEEALDCVIDEKLALAEGHRNFRRKINEALGLTEDEALGLQSDDYVAIIAEWRRRAIDARRQA